MEGAAGERMGHERGAERAHITSSSEEGGGGMSGVKVDEAEGKEEKRREAGSYACSAPPTLSETQDSTCPPSSRRTATHKSL